MKALILPVCGIWGPIQRSIIGPHRYTVVEVPSGILDSIICTLYLLYWCDEISQLEYYMFQTTTHAEHFEQSFLGHNDTLELLLFFDRSF